MMQWLKLLSSLVLVPGAAQATALAVTLHGLVLSNTTARRVTVQIPNLSTASSIKLAAHKSCKITQELMFLPMAAEKQHFVIMVMTNGQSNAIVIDRQGLLTLAADSALKMPYHGAVKHYGLYGFCGNNLAQAKFLKVMPHTNATSAPNFILANCQHASNFMYLINDRPLPVIAKKLDLTHIKNC